MKISVEHTFRATHAVASDPRLQQQHPHKWTVTALVQGDRVLPGWVMDFADLRTVVVACCPTQEQTFNDWCGEKDATAEVIAEHIFDRIEARLPLRVKLVEVKLEEGPGNTVYWP